MKQWISHPELIPGTIKMIVSEAKLFFLMSRPNDSRGYSVFAAIEEKGDSWQGYDLKMQSENGVPYGAVNAWYTSIGKGILANEYQSGLINLTKDQDEAYNFLSMHYH